MKTGQYFEGILQLRNPSKEVVEFIEEQYPKMKKKKVYVTKIKKVKGGFDYYITSKKYIQSFGRKLRQHFGGILKISPQLFSRDRQTSKDIYRVNVLLKLYGFKKGDILKINNKIIKVTSLDKKVTGTNLTTNKKTTFKIEDYKVLKKYKTTVCKIKPHIEVLHPETYENIEPKNKISVKLGEKVKVVLDKDDIYLI